MWSIPYAIVCFLVALDIFATASPPRHWVSTAANTCYSADCAFDETRWTTEALLTMRGGATKTKKLKMDERSMVGTLLLMFKSFFASLMDPTYMMPEATAGFGGTEADGETAMEEDEDPFARRAKAGLDRVGHHRTISVDELEKMGGGGKSRVKDIASSADFNKALATAGKKLVVVDFFATWCGPCKQIAPQFAELSGAHRKVSFLKVDVDKNRDLSSKYEVSSMPTFLFIQNGKVLHKMAGANIDAIKSKIETYS